MNFLVMVVTLFIGLSHCVLPVDNNANCPYWASIGECSWNPGYMLSSCKLSCNCMAPVSTA